jgi:hypothetical protein
MTTIEMWQLATGLSAGFCGGACLRWATELPLVFALVVGVLALMCVILGGLITISALK